MRDESFREFLTSVFRRFVDEEFARRMCDVIVVADPPMAELFAHSRVANAIAICPRHESLLRVWREPHRPVLICLSRADPEFERAIRLQARGPALDLWRDWILPRAAMGGRRPRPPETADPLRYAIVALPRTASTFLCYHLQAAGLGKPKEHVEDYLIGAVERGLVTPADLARWWSAAVAGQQKNRVFGTKLIGTALLGFLAATTPDGPSAATLLGSRIIRLRRDPVEVSASFCIAGQTKTWHLWYGNTVAKHAAALAHVRIDDSQLLAEYAKCEKAEAGIDAVLAEVGSPVMELDFDDYTREPDRAVREIARFLGVPPRAARPDWEEPESWNSHSELHRQTAARLRGLLAGTAGASAS